jgi:XTP/dITP diphosphohydrolase
MCERERQDLETLPRELLLATNNAHKAAELGELLADLVDVRLRTPREIGIDLDVVEDEPTFAGNSILKARAFAKVSGLLTLADDSGLEVEALDGAPGIRSARFAGPSATDRDRIDRLLLLLKTVPPGKRQAAFVCVVAVAAPNGDASTFRGECGGVITEVVSGDGGFGYDPVFYLPELGRTMASLTSTEKNAISHRGRAVRLAIPEIKAHFPSR